MKYDATAGPALYSVLCSSSVWCLVLHSSFSSCDNVWKQSAHDPSACSDASPSLQTLPDISLNPNHCSTSQVAKTAWWRVAQWPVVVTKPEFCSVNESSRLSCWRRNVVKLLAAGLCPPAPFRAANNSSAKSTSKSATHKEPLWSQTAANSSYSLSAVRNCPQTQVLRHLDRMQSSWHRKPQHQVQLWPGMSQVRSPWRGSSSSPRCCCFDKLLFLKRIHVELAVGHRRPAPPLHWSTPLFVFLVHVRYVKMIDNWREMWRYWTLFWLFTPSPDTSPCLWTNPSPLKSNHGN